MEPHTGASREYEKLQLKIQTRFRPSIRWIFFTMTVKQWRRLPREVVRSPSSPIYKTWLDKVLSNLVWSHSWPCFDEPLGLFQPEVSYNPIIFYKPCVILYPLPGNFPKDGWEETYTSPGSFSSINLVSSVFSYRQLWKRRSTSTDQSNLEEEKEALQKQPSVCLILTWN